MPWPRRRPLSEVVSEYRRRTLAREAKVAKRLRGMYRRVEKQLLRDVRRLVKKIEAANTAGLPIREAWLANLDSANELLVRLRGYIDEFSMIAGQTVATATKTAAIDGANHAAGLTKAASSGATFRRLNEDQLIDLYAAMEPGSPLYDLFRDLGLRAVSKARTILGEAAVQGKNPRVIARRLADNVQNLTETRALLIARTETMRSYRSATLRSYRANSDVVTGWRWMSARGSRVCPVCLAMDGTVHLLSEDFASHPACCVPGTVVQSPPVRGSVSRWYDGKMLDIRTEAGNVLSVTPNHPILTPHGWVAAGDLKAGDNVIRCINSERFLSAIDPYHDHIPALIEDVAESLRGSACVIARSVVVSAEDFHGDGAGSEVCIVRTDGLLQSNANAASAEPFSEEHLVGADVRLATLSGDGDLRSMFDGVPLSAQGLVSIGGVGAPLFGRTGCSHEAICIPIVARSEPGRDNAMADQCPTHAEGASDGVLGLTSKVSTDDLVDRDAAAAKLGGDSVANGERSGLGAGPENPAINQRALEAIVANTEASSDILDAVSSGIALDCIVEVLNRRWCGHVYNLETATGWYIANNVITHNCRCAATPITEYSDPPGETGEEWFSRQPEELQRKILGPSKLDLYKTGRMKLADLVEKTNHPRWGPGLTEAPLKTLLGKLPQPAPPAPSPQPTPAPVTQPARPKRKRQPRKTVSPVPASPPVVAPTAPPESTKLSILRARSARDFAPKAPKRFSTKESIVVKTALEYIDATFKDAPTRTRRVLLIRTMDANGSFDPATKIIRVAMDGNESDPLRMALTFVHEWGHSLDEGLGARAREAWATNAPKSVEGAKWLRAVKDSEAFLKLKRKGGGYGTYFTKMQECFARCMEMMMAKRLGPDMTRALDAKRSYWLNAGFPAYWEWDDFEPILEAFEEWLTAEGVLQ